MAFSERMQVLLSPEQKQRVERIAARRGVSVGAVIREAVDALPEHPRRSRIEAAKALTSMNAPVDDWRVMKEEIIRDRFPDDCLH